MRNYAIDTTPNRNNTSSIMHATSVKTEDVGSSDFLTRSSSNDNKDKGKGSHVKVGKYLFKMNEQSF